MSVRVDLGGRRIIKKKNIPKFHLVIGQLVLVNRRRIPGHRVEQGAGPISGIFGLGLSCHEGLFFFFKQKTAYEILRSDWSSDVCSSDLARAFGIGGEDDRASLSLRA